jgi:hypothetical protein
MSTLAQAMGIPDAFIEQSADWVETLLESKEEFSDVLIELINEVRSNEFGKGEVESSTYEKKLMAIGFITGRIATQMEAASLLAELYETKK